VGSFDRRSVLRVAGYCAVLVVLLGAALVFLLGRSQASPAANYVSALLASSDGLVAVQEERAVKLALLRQSKADCIVVGSSKIMTVTTEIIRLIHPDCKRVANLGVSGGSYEDVVAYTGAALDTGVRRIFIGIDHWSFRRNADDRYHEIDPAYDLAKCRLSLPSSRDCWTLQVRVLKQDMLGSIVPHERRPFPVRDAKLRSDMEATTRPDGSHVYSRHYMGTIGDVWNKTHLTYKLGPLESGVIAELGLIVDKLRERGISVTFLLVPYHPRALKCEVKELCAAIDETDSIIRGLAKNHKADVAGSFYTNDTSGFFSDMFADERFLSAVLGASK
jgi:hypothetical protein